VYLLSEKLADAIWDFSDQWKPFARDTVAKQLVRAADSIGANIAEGSGRGTAKDNCRFIQIARGSLYETVHFLRRAYKRRLLTDIQVKRLQPLITELGPRLNAYLTAVGQRKRVPMSESQRRKLMVRSANLK
jgi:four helix bundle protein